MKTLQELQKELQEENREKFLEWDKDATKLKCKPDDLIFFADQLTTDTINATLSCVRKMVESKKNYLGVEYNSYTRNANAKLDEVKRDLTDLLNQLGDKNSN